MRPIPVVVLTTSTAQDDIEASYALGANSFVSKPSSYAALTTDIATLGRYWLEIAALPSGRALNMLGRDAERDEEGSNGNSRRHELAFDRGAARR